MCALLKCFRNVCDHFSCRQKTPKKQLSFQLNFSEFLESGSSIELTTRTTTGYADVVMLVCMIIWMGHLVSNQHVHLISETYFEKKSFPQTWILQFKSVSKKNNLEQKYTV